MLAGDLQHLPVRVHSVDRAKLSAIEDHSVPVISHEAVIMTSTHIDGAYLPRVVE